MGTVIEDYRAYLAGVVCPEWKASHSPLPALFTILDETEFKPLVRNDENRIGDIEKLRTDWANNYGLGSDELAHKPFSVLELMVIMSGVLAFLCRGTVDYSTNERWFNEMCYNAGLRFDISDEENAERAERVALRRYDANGIGGFFPVFDSGIDQRRVEIWAQANTYIYQKYM